MSSEYKEDEGVLPSPNDLSELHEQIQELNKALQASQEKADSHWERLLRKEAELQNTERRASEEVEKSKKFAIERFSSDLLQVMDALEQGLSYTKNDAVMIDNLIEGMKLTHHALNNVLEKYGITMIDPLGKPFDPIYQEALTMQETKEMKPNHVLQVVQKGYLLNERLLRPARVIVSKAPI